MFVLCVGGFCKTILTPPFPRFVNSMPSRIFNPIPKSQPQPIWHPHRRVKAQVSPRLTPSVQCRHQLDTGNNFVCRFRRDVIFPAPRKCRSRSAERRNSTSQNARATAHAHKCTRAANSRGCVATPNGGLREARSNRCRASCDATRPRA